MSQENRVAACVVTLEQWQQLVGHVARHQARPRPGFDHATSRTLDRGERP